MPKARSVVRDESGALLFGICRKCEKPMTVIKTVFTTTHIQRLKLCSSGCGTSYSTFEIREERHATLLAQELVINAEAARASSVPAPTLPTQVTQPTPSDDDGYYGDPMDYVDPNDRYDENGHLIT